MAKDRLSIKLEGGLALERKLMQIQRQSVATRVVNDSLKSSATVVKKNLKAKIPKDKGALKKSLNHKLMNKALKNDRHTFMAGVYFMFHREPNENEGDGGWYHHLALNSHKTRGGGFVSNTNPIPSVVKQSEPAVRKKLGEVLAKKIATKIQAQIG